MGFSRQEYWSGLSCPSPGALADPGIETASLVSPALAGDFFTTSATQEALKIVLSERKERKKVKSLSRVQLFVTPWTVAIYGIFQARVLEWAAIGSVQIILPHKYGNYNLLVNRR